MNLRVIILILAVIGLAGACKNHSTHTAASESYTCPMHPQIIKSEPGNCPICGMTLVKRESGDSREVVNDAALSVLLKPTNEVVVSSLPTVSVRNEQVPLTIKVLGTVAYDTRAIGSIAARVSGRIEKLYIRSRFQRVKKGQRIMDVYSPEILTAEENLVMLLNNDPTNEILITAAKQKLLLLGMSSQQLQEVIGKRKPVFTMSVFSNYDGYVKDNEATDKMSLQSQLTAELSIKEGMYIEKGQSLFNVYDPAKAWVLLNIYPEAVSLVQKGQEVTVVPEVNRDKVINAKIDFIEPFYRTGNKTVTARVYFDNSRYNIPIGTPVAATLSGMSGAADWLPASAVVSLGLDKVVFVKSDDAFEARKINTGIVMDDKVQVVSGLTPHDLVAENAQYLMDSESFIKLKK